MEWEEEYRDHPLVKSNHPLLRNRRGLVRDDIKCVNDGRFYRNPDRIKAAQWGATECAKYYLCIGKYQKQLKYKYR